MFRTHVLIIRLKTRCIVLIKRLEISFPCGCVGVCVCVYVWIILWHREYRISAKIAVYFVKTGNSPILTKDSN